MSHSLFGRLARRYGPPVDRDSRRRFLAGAMAAVAGWLLSASGVRGGQRPGRDRPRVVVVGAGLGGLACAFELHVAGFDVRVLEARRRVGGRVLTFRDLVPGVPVEGGGEFIGANHPLWNLYARRFGLELLDVPEESGTPVVVLGRQRLEESRIEALYREMEAVLAHMTRDAEAVDADRPWESPEAARLDARSARQWLDGLEASPLARAAVAAQLTADNGQALERQSYLAHLAQVKGGGLERYWTDSEAYRCAQGNAALAWALARALGPERVELSRPVSAVVVREGRPVRVCCADGGEVECDRVVLNVPPPAWARLRFSPPLPDAFRPQSGPAVKYLSPVRARFWQARGQSPQALSDGDMTFTWEASSGRPVAPGAAGPRDGVEGMAEVCACLSGFAGGPGADRLCAGDRQARHARCAAHMAWLHAGWVEHAVAGRFMDWPGDPWAGAGYAFPAPGEVTGLGPRLLQGLGPLHFVGEYASYAFVGYMEGALQSGARVASMLAGRTHAPATRSAPFAREAAGLA